MMRARVSYSDWRLMAAFQRRDFLARSAVEKMTLKKGLEKADGINETLGIIVSHLMGF